MNILELKLNVYLYNAGTVKFVYKKTSKREAGLVNGKVLFYIGLKAQMYDEDMTKTEPQTVTFSLPKGTNELSWQYMINTQTNTRDLLLEIFVSSLPISG